MSLVEIYLSAGLLFVWICGAVVSSWMYLMFQRRQEFKGGERFVILFGWPLIVTLSLFRRRNG